MQHFAAGIFPGIVSSEATSFVERGLHVWRPSHVVLLGIAGSIERAELSLGDVVVSGPVFGYEVASVRGRPPRWSFRKTGHQAEGTLYARARDVRNDSGLYEQWQRGWVEEGAGTRCL